MFKLREFRRAHELKQDEMAEILDMTQPNYSRIEKGGLELPPSKMELLVEKFGIKDVELFNVDKVQVIASNNVNHSGNQNNGISSNNDMLEIIKKQNESICDQMEKYQELSKFMANQYERLLSIMEKVMFK